MVIKPTILDGKAVQSALAGSLRQRIAAGKLAPKLAIIQIGAREESASYIRGKKLFARRIGAFVEHVELPQDAAQDEVLPRIAALNRDPLVHGVIVQLPIPERLDRDRILDAILPGKDVDGLGSGNIKKLWEGRQGGFLPATAKGILTLLRYYRIPLEGRRVLVIGRSFLVGKPTALALLNADATVTIAHSKTTNLPELAREADILIVAAGKPHFIQRDHVRSGQVVIDVGITAVSGEKLEDELAERSLAGDVDFEAVKHIVSAISPVPGGVGPMTVASLFENLVEACERQQK